MGVQEEPQEEAVSSSKFYRYMGCFTSFLKREMLIIGVFASVILGFIVGMSINGKVQAMGEPDRTTLLTVLGFPGELLIRMLKMLVLPLIVCSLIVGLAGLEKHASGRVGRRAILYYLSTTLIAAVLGLLIVVTIQPGKKASIQTNLKKQPTARTLDSLLDLMRFAMLNSSIMLPYKAVYTRNFVFHNFLSQVVFSRVRSYYNFSLTNA